MSKKDKFAQMQQGGGSLSSFQDIVQQATTVAAIEKQAEHKEPASEAAATPLIYKGDAQREPATETTRFMRLPNPQIPFEEYVMVSNYCTSFANMTRQDFVELAIVEKLHNEGLLDDDRFRARQAEIKNRPPRGYRKGTKNK